MSSRQFPSFEEALSYLKERGKLQYYGRSGKEYEYCVYTLTIGVIKWHLLIHDNGLVKVTDQTYAN